MPKRISTATEVRAKAALTTEYVMATESMYSDDGNTEDVNQDFSTTGGNADREWLARKFVPDMSGYIATVAVILGKTGSPAGTIAAYIYTDDGESTSMPDAQVSGSGASDSLTCDDLSSGAGGQEETFRWTRDCPFVRAGVTYWVVLKTTGYTYSDGVTEVRWRTDADGATGLNECAKYDADASPAWTSVGADVGADLAVNMAKSVPLDNANQGILYVDFTKGSSDGVRLWLEFSYDQVDWYEEAIETISSDTMTAAAGTRLIEDTCNRRLALPVADNWVRISAKAETSATNAQVGIVAVVSSV